MRAYMLSNTAPGSPCTAPGKQDWLSAVPWGGFQDFPHPWSSIPETFLPTSRVCYFLLPPSGRVGKTPTHPTGSQDPEIKLTQNLIGEHEFETENSEQI